MKKSSGSLAIGGLMIFAVLRALFLAIILWLATCGIVKLVTLCFGWSFSWLVATGVFLGVLLFMVVEILFMMYQSWDEERDRQQTQDRASKKSNKEEQTTPEEP